MRYMLLIYGDEKLLNQEDREHCYQKSTQLAHDLKAGGKYVAASPLHPTSTATSVRVRDGKRFITDGPFAETKEQLGGYYIVDANDIDDVIDIVSRIPAVRWGTVEVRPVIELPGLPED